MQKIDIHSHVLPQIDDGSQSWEETMDMVYQAYETGTTEIAITHHILRESDFALEDEIIEKFEELKARLKAAHIPVRLHLGSELYYQPDLNLDHKIATYNNNGVYFLVEFPMQTIPRYVDEKFFEFIIDGKKPILAHPERNVGIIENPMRAYEFVQRGVYLQINSGSLTGDYGERVRQTAIALLNAQLVHFVGSDGHNTDRRPLIIQNAYEIIAENWGERYATALFQDNPRKAMAGEMLKIPEPQPVEMPKRRKMGLLRRLGF